MASEKQVIEFQVRLRDFMTKELKRLGVDLEKTSKKGKTGFDKIGRSAEKAGRKIKQAGGGLQKFMRGFAKFGRIMAGMVGLGAGLGGLITVFTKVRQGVQEAMAFSQAMAEVATISDEVRADTEGFTRAILDLSTAFGQSELATAKALYQTISAGFTDTAEAMYLVESASKLAVGGFAEINIVVDFLTGVINAYGKSVYEAEELTDLFFETVRVGKTTIPEMAKQMGAVMPIAANLGVSIEELSAMLATLTLGNIETSLATTYMRQALVAVLQPSEEAQNLMAANEFRFDSAKIAADGFVGVLKEMREKFGGNIAAMQKFFPNVRSFIPVLALAGNQWERFNEILEEFQDLAGREVTPTMQALETAMLSAGKKMEVMGTAARQGFMMLGMGLIEGITGPITSVKELQDMAFVFRDAIAGLKPLVEGFTALLIGAAGAMLYVFSSMADKMGFDDAKAKVLEQDLGNLSTILFNMAGSVMGGSVSVGEAFEEMSSTLRSGRKDLIVDALDARDALETATSHYEEGYMDLARHLPLALDSVTDEMRRTMPRYGGISAELINMTLEDIKKLKATSPLLVKRITEWQEEFITNSMTNLYSGDPVEIYGDLQAMPLGEVMDRMFKDLDTDERTAAKRRFMQEVASEYTDLAQELQTTWDAAELRIHGQLGTRDEEMKKMLSFKDVVAKGIMDFAKEGNIYDQMVEKAGFDETEPFALSLAASFEAMPPATAQEVIRGFTALGPEAAEAFYTGLAFSMEGYLDEMPDNIRAIMEPKFKQAMGFIGSKAGRTLKDALMVGKAGGPLTFDDIIEFKPEQEAALTTTIYNITQEMERQGKLMSDRTPQEILEKRLYLKDMELQLSRAQIELDHRRGDQSHALWEQDKEATEAAIARQKELILGSERIGFAWYKLQLQAKDLQAEMEQVQVYAVNALADGLAEGMMKMAEGADDANASWKEFSRSFLRTIAVMIMRAYMLQAIMAAIRMWGGSPTADFGDLGTNYDTSVGGGGFGGGSGDLGLEFAQGGMVPGGLGRMLPVGAYQSGGVVNQPSYAIMGEGGRSEAILPLERMAGGDLGVKAGGGGATNVNISINAVDAKGVDELLISRQDTLRNIIRQAMTESRAFRSTMLGQTGG